MEYIGEDRMTDASAPSWPTPFSPHERIEEPGLQMTNLQTEANPYYTASSPQIANPISPEKEHPRRFTSRVRNQRNIAIDELDNTNN